MQLGVIDKDSMSDILSRIGRESSKSLFVIYKGEDLYVCDKPP